MPEMEKVRRALPKEENQWLWSRGGGKGLYTGWRRERAIPGLEKAGGSTWDGVGSIDT